MIKHYEHNHITFCWDTDKAKLNLKKHGITFEEALTAFDDPFFVMTCADDNDEERDAIIGLDKTVRLLFIVHIEYDENCIRLISARRAEKNEEYLYANH